MHGAQAPCSLPEQLRTRQAARRRGNSGGSEGRMLEKSQVLEGFPSEPFGGTGHFLMNACVPQLTLKHTRHILM